MAIKKAFVSIPLHIFLSFPPTLHSHPTGNKLYLVLRKMGAGGGDGREGLKEMPCPWGRRRRGGLRDGLLASMPLIVGRHFPLRAFP
jgi:hypothetical protein